MRLKSGLALKGVWRAKGQLRREPAGSLRSFDGVEIAPFKNAARAAVSISADLELCWAWRELPEAICEQRAEVERGNVPFILNILEQAGIPITWATVGHIFLECCTRGASGLAHPEMPRPPQNSRWKGDWYAHDPCLDVRSAPGWYAPDLIRLIQQSRLPHEIGIHSFSHIDFSTETSTEELVRMEIETCIRAMKPFGVRPRSLVFCFNHMGYQHLDLLYQLGIIAVRHRDPNLRLAVPERTASGVYRIYESMNLRLARRYDYVDKAKIFIDESIRRGVAYHLWFHPSDERKVFVEAFAPIIRHLAALQRSNKIWVTTMGQLASYREAREQMRIRTDSRGQTAVLDLECPLDRERFGDPEVTLVVSRLRPPRLVMVSGPGATEKASLDFRFDEDHRTLTFDVRSSVSRVQID